MSEVRNEKGGFVGGSRFLVKSFVETERRRQHAQTQSALAEVENMRAFLASFFSGGIHIAPEDMRAFKERLMVLKKGLYQYLPEEKQSIQTAIEETLRLLPANES